MTDLDDDTAAPLSLLAKANLLLSAFTHDITTMGLTELSRRSGVPKASVHRLCAEMVELGYLARTPKGYQLGWRIYDLGRLVPGPARLREIARPALQDLRMVTRAVVHLAVPQGSDCVYLERIAGRRELAVVSAVGDRVPNHSTASGRLFLAHADEQTLAQVEQEALDFLSLQTPAQLHRLLEDIRQRRFSDEATILRGFKSISVPVVYPGTGHVIASISVTVDADRRDDQQLRHALWGTAADISRGLVAPRRPRDQRGVPVVDRTA